MFNMKNIRALSKSIKVSNPKSIVKCQNRICKSYLDRTSDYDTHNRVFAIYYLGRYNNLSIYHYNECDDINLTELKLKQTLPFYKTILCIPVEHNVQGIVKFDSMILDNKVSIPLPGLETWSAFTTSDTLDLNIILDYVNTCYGYKKCV